MHHLFSFAATGAYFILLSFIPFILILLACMRYTSISETDVMNLLLSVVPSEFERFVGMIVKEVYTKSIAVVPVSVVVALWSAAKGFHGLTFGLIMINNVEDERNWFVVRFKSMFYTVIFVIMILLSFSMMLFGQRIENSVKARFTIIPTILKFILLNRYVFSFVLMAFVFWAMYTLLPNKKMDPISQIPGALLVSLAWSVFSWIMSFFYGNSSLSMYGSMGGLICAMIWMYFCMYFFLIGGEVNYILSSDHEENLILDTAKDVAYINHIKKEKKKCRKEFDDLQKFYGFEIKEERR